MPPPAKMASLGSTKKILVLGCCGAGKSTFSQTLSNQTGLPVIHLDQHFWKAGWAETPPDEWQKKITSLCAQTTWIMDGNYSNTLAVRARSADMAIILDYGRLLCLRNIFKRVLSGYGKTRSDMAPNCPERFDFEFLRYTWRFNKNQRPKIFQTLAQTMGSDKIILLKSPKQTRRWLKELTL